MFVSKLFRITDVNLNITSNNVGMHNISTRGLVRCNIHVEEFVSIVVQLPSAQYTTIKTMAAQPYKLHVQGRTCILNVNYYT